MHKCFTKLDGTSFNMDGYRKGDMHILIGTAGTKKYITFLVFTEQLAMEGVHIRTAPIRPRRFLVPINGFGGIQV